MVGGCAILEELADRTAGPHEEEEGLVTYWQVTASDSSATDCTDASDWLAVVEGNEFPVDSYFMYMVESGGTEATGQSCDTLDPSSCSDSDEVYGISSHTLTYEADAEVIPGDASCDLLLWSTWTLEDEGEQGTFTLDITFSYDPDDGSCDAFDDAIALGSTNGFGMAACQLTVTADLDLAQIE